MSRIVTTRIITPIINQPSLFEGADSAFGLGDINPTLFLSPAKPGALIWGVGPTFTLPTATDSLLGSGKWSMGPAAVGLTMQGPWVFGALVSQRTQGRHLFPPPHTPVQRIQTERPKAQVLLRLHRAH